jgi:deoxyribodipyrimidine photo-lyase
MPAPTRVLWFRRDLRLRDHPALLDAAADDARVLGLFVLDPRLLDGGAPRVAYLLRTLEALKSEVHAHGGVLVLRTGDPEQVVPQVVAEAEAESVHISADFTPYGAARDRRVEKALGEIPLLRTGSPYAVAPGRITKGDGEPYQVFTPFFRAWREHGWRAPAGSDPAQVSWRRLPSEELPAEPEHEATLPDAGEAAALERWHAFCEDDLGGYDDDRDRPDHDTTSRMSPHLKLGTIHPRTMLADLAGRRGDGVDAYRRQLAWRDFYGSVLHFWPGSAHGYFKDQLASMAYDTGAEADAAFEAWQQGRTGYPIVDAGMRQLLAEGWMHNRVRMLVASFLVKDLHQEWTRGAAHFMDHLIDGDLANNQHGWQWVAGSGTDAAPYFRVFNPVTQGKKFDPDGTYVKRWVPELRDLPSAVVHAPWEADEPPRAYPEPIVDHAVERREALDRYDAVR